MTATDNPKLRHREIQSKIDEERKRQFQEKQFNFLVIGAEGSGKTSIINQLLHGDVFEEELLRRRSLSYTNVVNAMLAYCDAVKQQGECYSEPTSMELVIYLRNVHENSDGMFNISLDTLKALRSLWDDDAIKRVRRKNIPMMKNAEYFMSNLDRITSDNFIPTAQDIAYAQNSSSGVMEIKFQRRKNEQTMRWRAFEVRTMRAQMKKWIQCFDEIELLNFVVDVSEYDQKSIEDNSKTRIHDSLQLFDQVCNNRHFICTDSIVFLNKKDLFQLKFPYSPFQEAFTDYTGEDTVESSLNYISNAFTANNVTPKRFMFAHSICASHPQTAEGGEVTDIVIQAILRRLLENTGV